jgi:hypothetical protein
MMMMMSSGHVATLVTEGATKMLWQRMDSSSLGGGKIGNLVAFDDDDV